MTLTALVAFPFVAGALVWLLPRRTWRRSALFAASLAHAALVARACLTDPSPEWGGALALDALGRIFLGVLTVLFALSALYTFGYMALHRHPRKRYYVPALLFFLGSMTLATLSHHLGLFWVALEATTLSSAPLVFFDRSPRSLEAAWKYLILCSVGIALALAGNFFLALSTPPQSDGSLLLASLLSGAGGLSAPWLKAAFLFFLVGYGTKMGLAPMHTWLPDAHSEAPPPVSALLSGALLNCAFLGILRVYGVLEAAGLGDFARKPLLASGLLSMGTAAAFLVRQGDYKRLFAYSSVEHMGILAVGVGLGPGAGSFGALLHALNHSLAKGLCFFAAGMVYVLTHTKSVEASRGLLKRSPASAALLLLGLLAIAGTPPFGTFLSEFTILWAALSSGHYWTAAFYLLFLATAFAALASAVFTLAFGTPEGHKEALPSRSILFLALPSAVLALLSLVAGLYLPQGLLALLRGAGTLGGAP